MRTTAHDVLEEEARRLVKLNQSETRSIVRSYIFPDPEEKAVRVIHIDRQMFPEEAVMPIQFGPDPKYGLNHPMLIAVVDEGAEERLVPPAGWGSWQDAIKLGRLARGKAA